jgi:hypothetical protein
MNLKYYSGWPSVAPAEPCIIVYSPENKVFEVDISRVAYDGKVMFDGNPSQDKQGRPPESRTPTQATCPYCGWQLGSPKASGTPIHSPGEAPRKIVFDPRWPGHFSRRLSPDETSGRYTS